MCAQRPFAPAVALLFHLSLLALSFDSLIIQRKRLLKKRSRCRLNELTINFTPFSYLILLFAK